MPLITVSHVYGFVALIAVSGILLSSFMVYTRAVQHSSNTKQLCNLLECVATKATELISLVEETKAISAATVTMPDTVGQEEYWVRLETTVYEAVITAGFGDTPISEANLRFPIPHSIASGEYRSGHGQCEISCWFRNNTVYIRLLDEVEG